MQIPMDLSEKKKIIVAIKAKKFDFFISLYKVTQGFSPCAVFLLLVVFET